MEEYKKRRQIVKSSRDLLYEKYENLAKIWLLWYKLKTGHTNWTYQMRITDGRMVFIIKKIWIQDHVTGTQ